jgi:hypothetical protein
MLGTYILEQLADSFPDVYRFNSCVFPSEDDDVITSPYNSMLVRVASDCVWRECECVCVCMCMCVCMCVCVCACA